MAGASKRVTLALLAIAIAGLAFAAVAPAHSLTVGKAKRAAQIWGDRTVRNSDGDYVKATVFKCKKTFPHRVNCRVGYDSEATLPRRNYECVDYLTLFYAAHDPDEYPDYGVRYDRYRSTQGRGGC